MDNYSVLDVLTGVSINDRDKEGYTVVCTPTVNDVTVTYSIMTKIHDPNIIVASDGNMIYADTGETVEYTVKRLDECSIKICIDDTGITAFDWNNVYESIAIENDNVQILDIDEIKRIFLQQMKSNFIYNNKENGIIYVVDRIELGLVTIPKRNTKGVFLLVPGWTFYGSCEYSDGSSTDNILNDSSYYTSHLTLNAIDGSVVSN